MRYCRREGLRFDLLWRACLPPCRKERGQDGAPIVVVAHGKKRIPPLRLHSEAVTFSKQAFVESHPSAQNALGWGTRCGGGAWEEADSSPSAALRGRDFFKASVCGIPP